MNPKMAACYLPCTPTTLDLTDILGEIQEHIEKINSRLRHQAASFDPAIVRYVEYVCESPGKRLRAALALLSGGATGKIGPQHIDLGTIVELIHLASLIHDDILDHAPLRRGRATAHAKWGPELAVLLGDALFAHALKLCTNYDSTHLARRIACASTLVCQGEILQTQRSFDLTLSTTEYLKIIRLKTASLFSVAAELGAFLSGASPTICHIFATYGELLGVAFQIYDDCLDLIGHQNDAKKTLGCDLVRGKLTLPVLLHLERIHGHQRQAANDAILHGSELQRMSLICDLHRSGAFRDSLRIVGNTLENARLQLNQLDDSAYKRSLDAFVEALKSSVANMITASEESKSLSESPSQ